MLVVLEQLVLSRTVTHHQVAGCLIASSVVPVTSAIRIALSHPPPDELLGFVRIQGTFPHPSPFATYLVFLVMASSVLLVRSRPAVRLGLIVLVLASVVMIVQTYTRIAWLGLVVGMLLIGLNRYRKLLGAVVVGGVLLVLCVPQITARFSDIGDEAPVVGVASNSVAWRFGYWHQVADLGNTSPFTGAGLDTVNDEFPDRVEPHSLWFQLYGETGLVGLVAGVGVMVITGRALRRAKRDVAQRSRARLGGDRDRRGRARTCSWVRPRTSCCPTSRTGTGWRGSCWPSTRGWFEFTSLKVPPGGSRYRDRRSPGGYRAGHDEHDHRNGDRLRRRAVDC